MKHYKTSLTRTLLSLALAAATMGAANASELEVGQIAQGPATAGNNAITFTISNPMAGPISDVRVFQGGANALNCASNAATGQAFALNAGESVQCTSSAIAANGNGTTSITVLGKTANGVTFQQTAHQVYTPKAVPNQPTAGILVSAVFNNTDADVPAQFDAGETISYTYTVFNFGNVALAGLAVTDDLGSTINCGGVTSLAVGATLFCTSTHVITGTEVTAGIVSNTGYVDGTTPFVSSSDGVTRTSTTAAEVRGLKVPILTQDNDGDNQASLGDVVSYSFAVKNSGSLVLNPVNMTEADPTRIDGTITCNATTIGGSPFTGLNSGTLNVGDTVLCSASHAITAGDVSGGAANNLVNITGQPPAGGVASGSAASIFAVPPPSNSVALAATPVNDWRALLALGLGLLAAGFVVTRKQRQSR